MKKLANLKGAKALNRNEQQSINGGTVACGPTCDLDPDRCCGIYNGMRGCWVKGREVYCF